MKNDLLAIYDYSENGTEKAKKLNVLGLLIPIIDYSVLNFTTVNGIATNLAQTRAELRARVTAYDFIRTIYALNASNLISGPWSDNTNSLLAYMNYNCNDLGTNNSQLKLSDGTNQVFIESFVVIEDVSGNC